MKKITILTILSITNIVNLIAQTKLDSIFTNDEVIIGNVKEITPDAIRFCYPNEDLINTLYKNSIQKIVFSSGRTQIFSEASSFRIVKGAHDWENVTVSKVESEVKGLFKLDEVTSKARGSTIYSNMNKVKDRAYKKLKIETAMLGGNIIYLTEQRTEGAVYGHSTPNTTLSGIAYSSTIPNFSKGTFNLEVQHKVN